MLNIDDLKKKLEHMNLRSVSFASGVHSNSVYRLLKEGKASYRTISRLSIYFAERAKNEKNIKK